MKNKILYFLGSIIVVIGMSAFSNLKQSKTISGKELFSAYADMSQLDVALEVNAFMKTKESNTQESIISYSMEYRNNNSIEGLWYVLGNETVLRNKKWALQIDNQQKTITYYKRDPKAAKKETLSEEDKNTFVNSLKQYVQNKDMRFTYLKKEGGLTAYQTTDLSYPIKKAVFWLNDKKHIVKTTYNYHPNEYGQTNYVEVIYKKFNPTPSFDALAFSEKKYIQVRGKKVTPSTAFKDYQVIDVAAYIQK